MAADIRIPVLVALAALCMPLALADEPKAATPPKAPTARQVVEGLVRAQREAPVFTQAYRGVKTVDGKAEKDKEIHFEIHRSGGVTALQIDGAPGTGESLLVVADANAGRAVVNGKVAYLIPGPLRWAALSRPLELARNRLLSRWSLPLPPPPESGWIVEVALGGGTGKTVKFHVGLTTGLGGPHDLLSGLDLVPPPTAGTPPVDLVRLTGLETTVEIRRADGLVQRWEVRRPAEKVSCVLEAVPGGTTPTVWVSRVRGAMALDTAGAKEVPPEVLIGTADGSLAAQKLLSVLRELGDAQPGFWADQDRLPKAAAELIQAYAETRVSMQDGVPYALEALVLDLRKPFEALGVDHVPRREDRARALAILEGILRRAWAEMEKGR